MSNIVRVGIIGAGSIARRAHLPGFSPVDSFAASLAVGAYQYNGCPHSVVAAIADCDGDNARAMAERFQVPKVYENWRDLIADKEIDAVSITTPNYLHAEMAIAAAQAGKHVMVEKPMATTVEDADAMIEAADKAGVVLMVEQTERYLANHEVAKDIISRGCIGRIGSVRTRSSHQGPEFWSPGSDWFFNKEHSVHGAMFDLGIHKLDLIRWLIDDDVVEVAGFSDTLFKKGCEVEDHAVAILRFSKGTLGVLEAAWATDPSDGRTFVYGSDGNITLGGADPVVVDFPSRQALIFNFDLPGGEIKASSLIPIIPQNTRYGGPFRHFVDCIRSGEKPLSDGREGLKSLSVVLAALESARTGRFVQPQ